MSDHQKATAVLASQGYAPVMLAGLSDAEFAELVAMHGSDELPVRFGAWLNKYRAARKATVENDADKDATSDGE